MHTLDTAAVSLLYRDLSPGLMRHLRVQRVPADERDDVAMESFIILIRQLQRGKTIESYPAYLQRVADRLNLMRGRALGRRLQHELPVGGLHDLAEIEAKQYAEAHGDPIAFLADDLDGAIRDLPEEDRDAFILTVLRGLDQEEAAAVLEVDQSTVSRRAARARAAIREEIA